MPIDDLTERVRDMLEEYQQTRHPAVILDAAANRDAAALWQAVRTVDPDTAPAWLDKQVAVANALLGRLHYRRWCALPDGQGHAELARAVLCVELVADNHSLVPQELTGVVGRFTDPDAQAESALSLLAASESASDPALLDAAIQLLTPAAAATPMRGPGRIVRLSALCQALRRRHDRDDSATDLDRAVTAGERAVAAGPKTGPDAVQARSALAYAYWRRHRLRANPADLEHVITLIEWVLAAAEPNAERLADLGTAYRQRYAHTTNLAHLDRAVELGEQAVAQSADRSSLAVLSELGSSLLSRYERSGTRADLWRAAELAEQVVAALPADDPDRSVRLAGAASVLVRRYERSRDVADLHRAVELNEQALEILPENDFRRPDILRTFAVTLHQRYRGLGKDADLQRAATLGRWALEATRDDHPDWAGVAMDLAAIHVTQHAHTGVRDNLARAIQLGEQAISRSTPTPPDWLSTLGSAYQQRYPVTGTVDDLDQAINLGEQSMTGTGTDDFALPGRQARLASAYRLRHQHAASRADLNRAIDLLDHAVSVTPGDHLDLPERLSQLATTHLDRHRLDPEPSDVDAAVSLVEQALALLPTGHAGRARLTANLCTAYVERIIGGGAPPDSERVRQWAHTVADAQSAPVEQVSAHHAVGALAQAAGQNRLAVELLDAAIVLLPSVAPREAGWNDQHHRIGAHLGLVGAAVAAHCATGDPAGAVEIAELGRGVLLASQANTRIALDELADQAPNLLGRFRWVCEKLNTPGFPVNERKRWWTDYDQLLTEIRAQPGLADFIAAPRLADLRSTATAGVVILVNASRDRGDAIIVGAEADPIAVELPDLRSAALEDRVTALLDAVDSRQSMVQQLRRLRVVPDILHWVWDTIVAPITDALGSDGPHRVWWLPTGPLGLLPLHAAGHPGQPGALDFLVSSYVPSLRALRQACSRRPTTRRDSLTVAMHHTTGHPDLPGAADEATALGGTLLDDEHATADGVLTALQQANWTHFACHAVIDPTSQADSGLLLHDRILRLSEIGGLRLTNAELAYLSACSTANHGIRSADEVLHLASTFQLAGFRHVIASLWPLSNEIAVKAANSFYRALPDAPTIDHAATVLHKITHDLRNEYTDRPDLWAPLIHSGP